MCASEGGRYDCVCSSCTEGSLTSGILRDVVAVGNRLSSKKGRRQDAKTRVAFERNPNFRDPSMATLFHSKSRYHPRPRERIIIRCNNVPIPAAFGELQPRPKRNHRNTLCSCREPGPTSPSLASARDFPLMTKRREIAFGQIRWPRTKKGGSSAFGETQPSAPCAFEVEYLEIQNQDRDRATIESLSNDLAARKELYVTRHDRDLDSVKSLAAKQTDRPPDARVHTPAVIRRDRSRIPNFTDYLPKSMLRNAWPASCLDRSRLPCNLSGSRVT